MTFKSKVIIETLGDTPAEYKIRPNFVETRIKGRKLDSFIGIIRNLSSGQITRDFEDGKFIDIEIEGPNEDGTTEIEKKRWLVTTCPSRIINKGKQTYELDLTCVEYTRKWQNDIIIGKSFKQPVFLDDSDPTTWRYTALDPLKRILNDSALYTGVLTRSQLLDYDNATLISNFDTPVDLVTDTRYKYSGIIYIALQDITVNDETEFYDLDNTKEEYDVNKYHIIIDEEVETLLSKIKSADFPWKDKILFEGAFDIFDQIDAAPRLEFDYDEGQDVIKADFYNKKESSTDMNADKLTENRKFDASNNLTHMITRYENVTDSSVNNISFYPSISEYTSMKSDDYVLQKSSGANVSTGNQDISDLIDVKFDLNSIKNKADINIKSDGDTETVAFIIKTMFTATEVSGFPLDIVLNQHYMYDDYLYIGTESNTDVTEEEFLQNVEIVKIPISCKKNILEFIEYDSLPASRGIVTDSANNTYLTRANTMYFRRFEPNIYGVSFKGNGAYREDTDTFYNMIFSSLFKNTNFLSTYTNAGGSETNIRYDVNEGILAEDGPIDDEAMADIGFRTEFISSSDIIVNAEKINDFRLIKDKEGNYSTNPNRTFKKFINQQDRNIDVEKISWRTMGQVERLGVPDQNITKTHNYMDKRHTAGDYHDLNIITESSYNYGTRIITAMYKYNKNFNKQSERIKVDSQVHTSNVDKQQEVEVLKLYKSYLKIDSIEEVDINTTNGKILEVEDKWLDEFLWTGTSSNKLAFVYQAIRTGEHWDGRDQAKYTNDASSLNENDGKGGTTFLTPTNVRVVGRNFIISSKFKSKVSAGEIISKKGDIFGAGSFITGEYYKIVSINDGIGGADTNFTLIGADDNNIGTKFQAQGPGTNTGSARVTSSRNVLPIPYVYLGDEQKYQGEFELANATIGYNTLPFDSDVRKLPFITNSLPTDGKVQDNSATQFAESNRRIYLNDAPVFKDRDENILNQIEFEIKSENPGIVYYPEFLRSHRMAKNRTSTTGITYKAAQIDPTKITNITLAIRNKEQLTGKFISGKESIDINYKKTDSIFIAPEIIRDVYYEILSIGSTDFNSIGGDGTPEIGEIFKATGPGTGTGTVKPTNPKPYFEIENDSNPYIIYNTKNNEILIAVNNPIQVTDEDNDPTTMSKLYLKLRATLLDFILESEFDASLDAKYDSDDRYYSLQDQYRLGFNDIVKSDPTKIDTFNFIGMSDKLGVESGIILKHEGKYKYDFTLDYSLFGDLGGDPNDEDYGKITESTSYEIKQNDSIQQYKITNYENDPTIKESMEYTNYGLKLKNDNITYEINANTRITLQDGTGEPLPNSITEYNFTPASGKSPEFIMKATLKGNSNPDVSLYYDINDTYNIYYDRETIQEDNVMRIYHYADFGDVTTLKGYNEHSNLGQVRDNTRQFSANIKREGLFIIQYSFDVSCSDPDDTKNWINFGLYKPGQDNPDRPDSNYRDTAGYRKPTGTMTGFIALTLPIDLDDDRDSENPTLFHRFGIFRQEADLFSNKVTAKTNYISFRHYVDEDDTLREVTVSLIRGADNWKPGDAYEPLASEVFGDLGPEVGIQDIEFNTKLDPGNLIDGDTLYIIVQNNAGLPIRYQEVNSADIEVKGFTTYVAKDDPGNVPFTIDKRVHARFGDATSTFNIFKDRELEKDLPSLYIPTVTDLTVSATDEGKELALYLYSPNDPTDTLDLSADDKIKISKMTMDVSRFNPNK